MILIDKLKNIDSQPDLHKTNFMTLKLIVLAHCKEILKGVKLRLAHRAINWPQMPGPANDVLVNLQNKSTQFISSNYL